jgi:6-phosphofructokinase 1
VAQLIKGNAVVAQSGGPTAVINQSLVGVVEGLRGNASIGQIFGARHGVKGMVEEQFVDLTSVPQEVLDAVAGTPSAALGSSRDKPDAAYCEKIVAALKKRDIRYFFYIGGNDSSDTCRIVWELANKTGYELRAFHVPKTIDNDLMMNDHTPGFASAARYVAMAFMGDNLDNRALPGIKINVVMGRHAGFLTAAAALLREREEDGPHVICVPEVPFVADAFFDHVAEVYAKHKRCLIAVSEGIQNKDGIPVLQFIGGAKETDAHGNVRLSGTGALGDTMAQMITAKLTKPGGKPPRVRADTLGYAQRYWPDASPVDAKEAREVGRRAAAEALGGAASGSIAINRVAGPGSGRPSEAYQAELSRVELSAVAAKTRHLPKEFLKGDYDVSKDFVDWLRPLVGPMPRIGRL